MLSSARMRRRLIWLGAIGAAIGLIVLLAVVVFPASKPSAAEKMSNQKADIVRTPKSHHFDQGESAQIGATAKAFIATGVREKHLSQAWDLMAPALRTGYTKGSFVKGGSLPFQPYPADPKLTRGPQISFSYANEVGLRYALFPHAGSKLKPLVVDIVERKYGHSGQTHWLVSSLTPAPSASGDFGSVGGSNGGNIHSPGSAANIESPVRHVSQIWLILPFGLLVGGLIIGLGTFLIYRSWRNAAIYRAHVRESQRSSWRPS